MQFACERVTTEAYLHFFRGGKKVVTRNLYGHVLDKCRRALWYKLAVLCWRTEKKKKTRLMHAVGRNRYSNLS